MNRLALQIFMSAIAIIPVIPVEAQNREMAALNGVCRRLIDSGDDVRASSICRRVNLEVAKLAPDSPEYLTSLVNLAELKRKQNNNLAADSLLADALIQLEKIGKGETLEAAELLELQAEAKVSRGKVFEAEPSLRRAVKLRETLNGPASLEAASTRVRHATVLGMLQQFQAAHVAYRRSLSVYEHGGGATRDEYLRTQHMIAELLHRQARYSQAEVEYRRLLDDASQAPAVSDLVVAALDRLAWLALQDGRAEDAVALYRREIAELGTSVANSGAVRAAELRIEAAMQASAEKP